MASSLDGASKANSVTAVPPRSVEVPCERLNDRTTRRRAGRGKDESPRLLLFLRRRAGGPRSLARSIEEG